MMLNFVDLGAKMDLQNMSKTSKEHWRKPHICDRGASKTTFLGKTKNYKFTRNKWKYYWSWKHIFTYKIKKRKILNPKWSEKVSQGLINFFEKHNKNNRKIVRIFRSAFGGRFLRFWDDFGVENGGKITKNLSEMRSENENGDFSRIVLPCTREHDYWGSETSKIEQKYQKNYEKTHCKKARKKQLFIDFG